jgi:hypothetical protein
LLAVAVKVTGTPEQIDVLLAVMLTVGALAGDTVIVIAPDVADVVVAHDTLDVITQETTSLLARLVLAYVVELNPTLPPFNFH